LIITSDGQYLLVADTGNDEIKILQPGSLKILGQFGTGYLKSPRSIKIDEYGKIWVIDDENKRVTSFSFKGVFKNGTVNVKMIEQRNNVKTMQTSTKPTANASGQSYVVNSPKNQIEIFNKSGAQIGIYRAEGMKTPMAVETIGLYFWIADTGNNRILLLKAPRQLEP
jgi:DNA-binding beta-propeller fold protein YncE